MKTTATTTLNNIISNWTGDTDIFDVIIKDPQITGIPTIYSYNSETIVRHIINSYGEWLFVYNTLPNPFQHVTTTDAESQFTFYWLDYIADNMINFQRIGHAYNLIYNPINSYMKNTNETVGQTGNNNTTTTDDFITATDIPPKNISTHTYGDTAGNDIPTNTTKQSTFDDANFVNTIQNTSSGTETTVNYYDTTGMINPVIKTTNKGTRTKSETNSDDITRNTETTGNIGLIKIQDLIKSEIDLRKFDMLDYIVDGFIKKYCFLAT